MSRSKTESETQPAQDFDELLEKRLGGAYGIGILTYYAVSGKDVSALPQFEVDNLPGRGKINLDAVRAGFSFGDGMLWTGVGIQDQPEGGVQPNKKSVLRAYSQLLEQAIENKRHAKNPRPGIMRIIARSGGYINYSNFFTYWQDVIPQMQDNKALWQYAITQLRAVILGFAAAAGVSDDVKTRSAALRIMQEYKESQRIDPLKMAGLIDVTLPK